MTSACSPVLACASSGRGASNGCICRITCRLARAGCGRVHARPHEGRVPGATIRREDRRRYPRWGGARRRLDGHDWHGCDRSLHSLRQPGEEGRRLPGPGRDHRSQRRRFGLVRRCCRHGGNDRGGGRPGQRQVDQEPDRRRRRVKGGWRRACRARAEPQGLQGAGARGPDRNHLEGPGRLPGWRWQDCRRNGSPRQVRC
ncbi:hypothetical protein D3C71_1092740 [compost metagenome]